ncbi:hypothetical protein QUV44_07225 [Parasutterella secunda]|uniref:hypothetical protein n=1 Tax=Parasutterella secunda TaxID=626947 RepID=UPI0025A3BDA3|nr:hypothetical protein [Parasutterella secunda]MDM8087984.1 hypothetical protein [Parasutterella secunda]
MSSKKLFRLSGVALAVALLTASLPSQAIDITTETQYNPQNYQNQQSITILVPLSATQRAMLISMAAALIWILTA